MFDKIHFYKYNPNSPSIPYELEGAHYFMGNLVIVSSAEQAIKFNKEVVGRCYVPERIGIYLREDKMPWVDVSEKFGVVAHFVNKFSREICR
jgi:hypothetical protein